MTLEDHVMDLIRGNSGRFSTSEVVRALGPDAPLVILKLLDRGRLQIKDMWQLCTEEAPVRCVAHEALGCTRDLGYETVQIQDPPLERRATELQRLREKSET